MARAVIIGGGYVGLEAAASARALGAEAVVIERMDRVLQWVASQPLSDFYTRRHAAEGVHILCVEAVNSAPSFMFGKQAIARASAVNTAILGDRSAPIKSAVIA